MRRLLLRASLPARLVALAGVAAVSAGCGEGVGSLSFPAPPPTRRSVTTVAQPPADYTGVVPPKVAGTTTTTLPVIGPGRATVDGTVIGPSGPVAGATVQAERLVGGVSAVTQATTARDGSFSIARVLGGIYRLRAWQPPMLAMTTAEVFFVGADQTVAQTLQLQSFSNVQIGAAMAPPLLQVGDPANLVVSVTQQVVGPDGVVRPVPMADQSVEVVGGGAWSIVGTNPATTDGQGRASFALTCASAPLAPSSPVVAIVTGAPPATVSTSTCAAPPASTTTLPSTIPGSTLPTPNGSTPTGPGPTGPGPTGSTLPAAFPPTGPTSPVGNGAPPPTAPTS